MSEPYWVPLGAEGVDRIPVTIFDAKGDLLVGSAADAAARLAVGANGQQLQADSAAPLGLKWASVPTARIYRATAQSIPATTQTLLSFSNARYDTDSMWAVGQPTRLTCKTAGTFVLSAHIQWAIAAGTQRQLRLWVNGATYLAGSSLLANVGLDYMQSVSTVWSLGVNDYVEVQVYQDSAGALNINPTGALSPELSMARIGA